jgi:Ca-activated chloride channel family protein
MVAKDAKVQVEFNPARVAAWRLIGYEKRHLRSRDFADDRVDSGDVGAGAHVVALYELETRSAPGAEAGLRYQGAATLREDAELLFVQLRWKRPDRTQSELLRLPVVDRGQAQGGTDFRFAAAVAAFGLALRDSPNRGAASLSLADELARDALGDDPDGRRRGFIQLIGQARRLAPER